MAKRPSDEAIRDAMNEYAKLLLDAHYGYLRTEEPLPPGKAPDILPKPDVFNAVVNWLRTESGMDPAVQEKSGIGRLTDQLQQSRKR